MGLTVLAVLGVGVVWIVYRLERWSTRAAVLEGLRNELSLHSLWVGKPYPLALHGSWKEKTYLVHRLGTVAIDDAIVRGPGILLNRQLGINLVIYRQVLTHFNQLIDQAMAFQARPELWVANPSKHMVDHMLELIEAVHLAGIGGDQDGDNKAAHWYFKHVETELEQEDKIRVMTVVWGVTAINFRFLRRWREWVAWAKKAIRDLGSIVARRATDLVKWAKSLRP